MTNNKVKRIGIWLDHSKAYFIRYDSGESNLIEIVDSPHQRIKREKGEARDDTRFTSNPLHVSNNENRKHNVLQNELKQYYKILEPKTVIYDEILLFGPTLAKEEFYNIISELKAFKNKSIIVQSSDKMTENQKLAYVRDFFQQKN